MAEIIGWVRPGGKDWTASRILAVMPLILKEKMQNNITKTTQQRQYNMSNVCFTLLVFSDPFHFNK